MKQVEETWVYEDTCTFVVVIVLSRPSGTWVILYVNALSPYNLRPLYGWRCPIYAP